MTTYISQTSMCSWMLAMLIAWLQNIHSTSHCVCGPGFSVWEMVWKDKMKWRERVLSAGVEQLMWAGFSILTADMVGYNLIYKATSREFKFCCLSVKGNYILLYNRNLQQIQRLGARLTTWLENSSRAKEKEGRAHGYINYIACQN